MTVTIPAWAFLTFVTILFLFVVITAFNMLMTLVLMARFREWDERLNDVCKRVEDTGIFTTEPEREF